ncbi:MAG: hypothetical protein ACYYKD_10085 [Rhodospirillales bacterium]
MEINAYGPPTREIYEQQQTKDNTRARRDDAAAPASPPGGGDAVQIDEKTAKVLELLSAKKGGNEFTLEDLQTLVASGELSEDLKSAADRLIADLKAAEAEAGAKAGAGADGALSAALRTLLDNLRESTGKDKFSVKDLESYAKSNELSKEEKTAIEELIARLREAEGKGSSDAANAA